MSVCPVVRKTSGPQPVGRDPQGGRQKNPGGRQISPPQKKMRRGKKEMRRGKKCGGKKRPKNILKRHFIAPSEV